MPAHYSGEHWHKTRELGSEPGHNTEQNTSLSRPMHQVSTENLSGTDIYPDSANARQEAWEKWKERDAAMKRLGKKAVTTTVMTPSDKKFPIPGFSNWGEVTRQTSYVVSQRPIPEMENQPTDDVLDQQRETA
jgi:hypothetical protein